MACVVLTMAARDTSIGCHCDPIAAVDAAAIQEYTENNRYCSWAVCSSSVDALVGEGRRGTGPATHLLGATGLHRQ